MNRLARVASAVLFTILLSGCAIVASPVGNGAIFTSVRGPIVVGPQGQSPKSGSACAANYFGIVAVGDASIEAAKRSGGISDVSTVDHESFGVLGLYSRFCTKVTGQ